MLCFQGSTGDFTPSKLPNGNISSQSTMSSPGTVAVPQRIHSITQQYLSNINNIVQCHEFWDQAEAVYSDYKGIIELIKGIIEFINKEMLMAEFFILFCLVYF